MSWLLMLVLALDLSSVKLEPNLERRSDLALDHANEELDAARDAFNANDAPKMQTALEEITESVNLSYQSLLDTGKDARRNPKFFKRAELRTRDLVRRLEGLEHLVDVDSRAYVDKVKDRVSEVHDDLLKSIMSKKK
ncbi:MAG TPA: hypothetical protein VKR43_07260 [Bryobacteraceae bacterium]|jgi:hypothetical protein|nr:hypothetical protein [Bryobacteraceae bacterium]